MTSRIDQPDQPDQIRLKSQRARRSPLSRPVLTLWEAIAQLQSVCRRGEDLATFIHEQDDDVTLCDDAQSQAAVFDGFATFWQRRLATRAAAILHQNEEEQA